jgi:RNA polymerase sigma factor (sigma-70 family)
MFADSQIVVVKNPCEQWVERLKELDSEAWDFLLRRYGNELRQDILKSLRRRGLSAALVDDIEQETWLTAVRRIDEFVWESENKFYRWLRVISLNHIHTYRRMLYRETSIEDFQCDEDLDYCLGMWGLHHDSPEETVVLHEQLSALDRALRILKPHEREMVVRWLMGEPPRELARVYQMKPRSVSMLLLRAKGKIEAQLMLFEVTGHTSD